MSHALLANYALQPISSFDEVVSRFGTSSTSFTEVEVLKSSHLLAAAIHLDNGLKLVELPPKEVGKPLMQGASALAAPALGTADDRSKIAISEFFLLQLPHYNLNMLGMDAAGVTSDDSNPSLS